MSYLNWSLGQIATEIPGATSVLFNHKINFCCDGKKTLEETLSKRGVDEDEIILALGQLENREHNNLDWSSLSNSDLIDHIVTRYHQVHRQQLAELVRLAQRVESVHRHHQKCPAGLADHLTVTQQQLELHMQKEEGILFPMLSSGSCSMAAGPISAMTAEHNDHIESIEMIYRLTGDLVTHPDACNTWKALYLGLREFISDINMHIHLENNLLFERALTI